MVAELTPKPTPTERVHLGMTWAEIETVLTEYREKVKALNIRERFKDISTYDCDITKNTWFYRLFNYLGLGLMCFVDFGEEKAEIAYKSIVKEIGNDADTAIRTILIAIQKLNTTTETFTDGRKVTAEANAAFKTGPVSSPVFNMDVYRKIVSILTEDKETNPKETESQAKLMALLCESLQSFLIMCKNNDVNNIVTKFENGIISIMPTISVLNLEGTNQTTLIDANSSKFKDNNGLLKVDFASIPDLVAMPNTAFAIDTAGVYKYVKENIYQGVWDATILGFKHHDRANQKHDDLFIGLEWECNRSSIEGGFSTFAADFLSTLGVDYGILKQDGSVDGFEFNSCPATYEVHMQRWTKLKEAGVMSRAGVSKITANKTGIHMHFSRSAFTKEHAARFFCAFNHPSNKNFIVWVAGRDFTTSGGTNFAKFETQRKLKDVASIHDQRTLAYQDKYSAVNTLHKGTYEVRLFKTRHDPDEMFMLFDFAKSFYEFTKQTSDLRIFVEDYTNYLFKHTGANEYIHIKKALIDKAKKDKAKDIVEALRKQNIITAGVTSRDVNKLEALLTGKVKPQPTKTVDKEVTLNNTQLYNRVSSLLSMTSYLGSRLPYIGDGDGALSTLFKVKINVSFNNDVSMFKLGFVNRNTVSAKTIQNCIKAASETIDFYNSVVGIKKLIISKLAKLGVDDKWWNDNLKSTMRDFFNHTEEYRTSFTRVVNELVVCSKALGVDVSEQLKELNDKYEARIRISSDLKPSNFDPTKHKIPSNVKVNTLINIKASFGLELAGMITQTGKPIVPLNLIERYRYALPDNFSSTNTDTF